VTDLEWLTDDRPVAAYPTKLDGACVLEAVVFDLAPGGGQVRLTWDPEKERLLVNGVDEEREDFLSLNSVLDEIGEADVPAGNLTYLGAF
jgi:hypothetical protein